MVTDPPLQTRFDLDAQRDLSTLRRLVAEIAEREAELAGTVARLRARWVPWSAIAQEIGISTQGAQQRYRSERPAPR